MCVCVCRLNELLSVFQEKEKNTELTSGALEKELAAVHQAIEQHKKEAQNSVQVCVERGWVVHMLVV